jgi:hypothetical protein
MGFATDLLLSGWDFFLAFRFFASADRFLAAALEAFVAISTPMGVIRKGVLSNRDLRQLTVRIDFPRGESDEHIIFRRRTHDSR